MSVCVQPTFLKHFRNILRVHPVCVNLANSSVLVKHKHTRRKCVSNMYQSLGSVFPKDSELACKSHKLFLYGHIIHQCHAGGFNLLPSGFRVFEKLVRIIDQELDAIGAEKMSMTSLAPAALWKKSERWDQVGKELFRLKDHKNGSYCLGPTHEEVITSMVASEATLSYKRLPLRLYQITRKFRDEITPRYGLLRCREFEMKDLYTFDASIEDATETYHLVREAYRKIFDRLGVKYSEVIGSAGTIGGSMSHEFQIPADIGEDEIHICKSCGFGANSETPEAKEKQCSRENCGLTKVNSIEVGHTFLLGTKYSDVFDASFFTAGGRLKTRYQMGCYGLGVSRIMQACVEVLSTENKEIIWPRLIAPYQFCIIPQESDQKYMAIAESLYDLISERDGLQGEVVLDDRNKKVQFRLFEARIIGYPYIITVKDKAVEDVPIFEVIDTKARTSQFLSKEQIMDLATTIETV